LGSCLFACGIHLREANEFGYKTMLIVGETQITAPLKKTLKKEGVEITDEVDKASLQVDLVKEESQKRILSLSGTGKVTEYELYYRIHYRTKPSQETLWSQPSLLEARREFSYNDTDLLAKQDEERLLVEDMHKEVLGQLVRRLAALKKP
jgi:LPS-assembly lipoprotein